MSTPLKLSHDGAALLESRMHSTFGVSHDEYTTSIIAAPVPTAYLTTAIRVVKNSGVLEMLATWHQQERKSNAGRPAIIPVYAVLVLFLLNMQLGRGITYRELANTVHSRFKKEHFDLLGIRDIAGDHADWYQRIWQGANRLIRQVDPYPSPLNRKLTAVEYAKLLERRALPDAKKQSERNLKRLDDICNKLVVASLGVLPRDIWNTYRGNIAIDATKAELTGRPNGTGVGARTNPDPFSGRYRREGNHDGQGASTDVAAYELETAVMIWNRPGENTLFPTLITAISCHRPGQLRGHAAQLVKMHQELGFGRLTVAVDRAYNGEKIENFHIPIRLMGVDPVFEYKKDDLGLQSHYGDLILVDGNWYVEWMPQHLIDASSEYRGHDDSATKAEQIIYSHEHRSTPATDEQIEEVTQGHAALAEANANKEAVLKRIDNRGQYRMIPKGLPDADGHQRFTYPDVKRMLVRPANPPTARSIGIPLTIPNQDLKDVRPPKRSKNRSADRQKPQPMKHIQTLPYLTAEWRATYGMRNLVESSNNLLKLGTAEDMANPRKRSGRGFTFNYLAMAIAVVSSNLNRIVTFFIAEAKRASKDQVLHRARRRKNEHGIPLSPSREMAAVGPPA